MKVEQLVLGPLETNCYLVSDELGGPLVVVDPGFFPEQILREIGTREVAAIVLTHRHFDHIGALAEVAEETGAPVMAHDLDADAILDPEHNLSTWMSAPVAPESVDRRLRDGDVVEAGELRLTVLHTPGHTAGGICLVGDGVCLSGDTLFALGCGRTDLPTGSMEDLRRSFSEKLYPLDDDTLVFPGHGESSTIGRERRLNPLMKSAR